MLFPSLTKAYCALLEWMALTSRIADSRGAFRRVRNAGVHFDQLGQAVPPALLTGRPVATQ